MDSYLIMPNGNKLEGVKYFDILDTAKYIVEYKIKEDINLKNKFNEFKMDYKYFEPYLDFLIIHLGYKFMNPFFDEGILYGEDGELRYKMYPENNPKDYIVYPKSDNKSLGIDTFSVDTFADSVISPDGVCYKFDRTKGGYHGRVFKLILMNKMSYSKILYNDFITCMNEKSNVYYNIDAYFINRLGYLQAVKYSDNTGRIIYNNELKGGFVDGLLKGVHEMYPKVHFEETHIPSELIEEAKDMKSEMIDIYDGRRIRF